MAWVVLDEGCCRSVLFHRLMFKADGNVLAFENRLKCVLLDLVELKKRRLPSDIRKRAERYLVRFEMKAWQT